MNKILEINDLKKLAKKKLPKMFYDYVDSGSYFESTYKENETDFRKIKQFLRHFLVLSRPNRVF